MVVEPKLELPTRLVTIGGIPSLTRSTPQPRPFGRIWQKGKILVYSVLKSAAGPWVEAFRAPVRPQTRNPSLKALKLTTYCQQ